MDRGCVARKLKNTDELLLLTQQAATRRRVLKRHLATNLGRMGLTLTKQKKKETKVNTFSVKPTKQVEQKRKRQRRCWTRPRAWRPREIQTLCSAAHKPNDMFAETPEEFVVRYLIRRAVSEVDWKSTPFGQSRCFLHSCMLELVHNST